MLCLLILFTHTISSYATDTPIHTKSIGQQKIGENYSAKNVPAKNMTQRYFLILTVYMYSKD